MWGKVWRRVSCLRLGVVQKNERATHIKYRRHELSKETRSFNIVTKHVTVQPVLFTPNVIIRSPTSGDE